MEWLFFRHIFTYELLQVTTFNGRPCVVGHVPSYLEVEFEGFSSWTDFSRVQSTIPNTWVKNTSTVPPLKKSFSGSFKSSPNPNRTIHFRMMINRTPPCRLLPRNFSDYQSLQGTIANPWWYQLNTQPSNLKPVWLVKAMTSTTGTFIKLRPLSRNLESQWMTWSNKEERTGLWICWSDEWVPLAQQTFRH